MAGLLAALTGTTAAAAPGTTATGNPGQSRIAWHDCPQYSDEALRFLLPPERIAEFRRLWSRMRCAKVSVPLDYGKPGGRRIDIAFTLLPATDKARRIGAMGLNPGGPGGPGYLMGVNLMFNPGMAALNERYDLIGFDPRGVGYSSKVECAPPGPLPEPEPGPVTEAWARQAYDAEVRFNQACGNSDPAFLGQLTTENVARDLDRIRAGLGERRLSFFGVSCGTWLGAVYRNLFGHRVERMWLDSTAIPGHRFDRFANERAAAAEQNSRRMTEWIAKNDSVYGLGSTAAQVSSTLLALQREFNANPRRFSDLDFTFDASFIAVASSQPSPAWPVAAQVLKELREASGPTAPPTVKEVLSGGGEQGPPPPDLPPGGSRTMNHAVFCNEDTGPRHSFDAAWAAYQRRLAANPLTGASLRFSADCTGWPLPNASLVLSGHLHESPSPYQWTWEMRQLVGGSVLTVADDVHGSVPEAPECAAKLVAYFDTGRAPRHDRCAGIPGPETAGIQSVHMDRFGAFKR
jgi:pimeloyl-ACP methyl ester carboxylesterase